MFDSCGTGFRQVEVAGLKSAWILFFFSTFPGICASAQSSLDMAHVSSQTQTVVAAASGANGEMLPIMRKRADLVLVPVTVSDSVQRLVTGLRQDNFQVFENRRPQQIKHFSNEDVPVSLGIIVDTSGSMADKMERVQEAIHQFCASSNPQDEFFVIAFSDQPHLVHGFKDSPHEIEEKLMYVVPKGRTALLDAIYMGIEEMRDARYGKKALLIISDGGDNHSRYNEHELRTAVKESDVMMYDRPRTKNAICAGLPSAEPTA